LNSLDESLIFLSCTLLTEQDGKDYIASRWRKGNSGDLY